MAQTRVVLSLAFVLVLLGAVAGVPGSMADAVSAAALPGEAASAGGTRYLDPIFAGATAPKVEASYDPTIPLNREQLLTVRAQSGTFSLTVGGMTTAALWFNSSAITVRAALSDLPTVNVDGVEGNDVTVTGGVGDPFGGGHYRIVLNDTPAPGSALPKVIASNVSLSSPIGMSVTTQCVRCLDVYQPQEAKAPSVGRPVVVIVHGGA